MTGRPVPRALTIAGSDSGGCAGIQADLKTFAALEVHGMSVITSVTAQNTRRVYSATHLPLESIELQIQAVMEDIGLDAAKTGMLPTAEIVRLVSHMIRQYGIDPLVVDPVMVSTGGDRLIDEDTVEVMKQDLFPLATVLTPNLQEAELLAGLPIRGPQDVETALQRLSGFGCGSVLIKGGHLDDSDQSIDHFFDGRQSHILPAPRIKTDNTHGSGCTLAAAITARLASGLPLGLAVPQAKEFVTQAIRHGLPIGHGHGPLGHFWEHWDP